MSFITAMAIAQTLYLVFLAIGIMGLISTGGSRDRSVLRSVYWPKLFALALISLLVMGFNTESAKEASRELGISLDFFSTKTAFRIMFTADVLWVSYLILTTGGSGKSIFRPALVFIPTLLLFLTRQLSPMFISAACIVVLMFVLLKDFEAPNYQENAFNAPELSVLMNTLFLGLNIAMAYLNSFRP